MQVASKAVTHGDTDRNWVSLVVAASVTPYQLYAVILGGPTANTHVAVYQQTGYGGLGG